MKCTNSKDKGINEIVEQKENHHDRKSSTTSLPDLRKKIYLKAKAETTWKFWGLYVHVCKLETIQEAYRLVKKNNGAPGIDGITFADIEAYGLEKFLTEIRSELIAKTYYPKRNRLKEIPKNNGKTRTLGIPTIKDRIVQGALKLILEPIFEADFCPNSFGYRPKRKAATAISNVRKAIISNKTKVIDIDLKAYFDNVRHHILLQKIATRISDKDILHLVKLILKASGKKGVPQGGIISPLFSNIYLNEVDKMLEKAKKVTTENGYTHLEYCRWADDLVVLIDNHPKQRWLLPATYKRICQELEKLQVTLNTEKTKILDLTNREESFGFLGFNFRRVKARSGKWMVITAPKAEARNKLLDNIKKIFKGNISQPIKPLIEKINPILRGWINYFRIGNSSRCFSYIKWWLEKKVRRHLSRACKRSGFGWKRWSSEWIYQTLKLYSDYQIRYV